MSQLDTLITAADVDARLDKLAEEIKVALDAFSAIDWEDVSEEFVLAFDAGLRSIEVSNGCCFLSSSTNFSLEPV